MHLWGLGSFPVSLDPVSPVFLQGVEFFDEKLNSLCMAWLVDHGELLRVQGRLLPELFRCSQGPVSWHFRVGGVQNSYPRAACLADSPRVTEQMALGGIPSPHC